jgi:hypothetical protein
LGLGGLIFLVVGIVAAFAMGQTIHLTCERLEDRVVECEIKRSFLGLPVSEATLSGIRGARVAERVDSDGDRVYRVELSTDEGRKPLTKGWSSGYANKAELAEEVDAFITGSTAPTLETQSSSSLSMLFGLVFGLIGLAMIVLGFRTSTTVWAFDRVQGVVSRRVARLTGPRVTEYDLAEVEDVYLESDSDGDSFRIVLWMAAGQKVPLLGHYSSGRLKKAQTVQVIRDFLGLGVSSGGWPMM